MSRRSVGRAQPAALEAAQASREQGTACAPQSARSGVETGSGRAREITTIRADLNTRYGPPDVGQVQQAQAKAFVEYLKTRMEAGEFRAVIDRQYPLEAIADAYRYVESERKTGIVVVNHCRRCPAARPARWDEWSPRVPQRQVWSTEWARPGHRQGRWSARREPAARTDRSVERLDPCRTGLDARAHAAVAACTQRA